MKIIRMPSGKMLVGEEYLVGMERKELQVFLKKKRKGLGPVAFRKPLRVVVTCY